MAALAYRDDKILARNLLSRPFFCLTPAEPFFRPDRSSTAPSCRVAVNPYRSGSGYAVPRERCPGGIGERRWLVGSPCW
jgi:hypothetical protein